MCVLHIYGRSTNCKSNWVFFASVNIQWGKNRFSLHLCKIYAGRLGKKGIYKVYKCYRPNIYDPPLGCLSHVTAFTGAVNALK